MRFLLIPLLLFIMSCEDSNNSSNSSEFDDTGQDGGGTSFNMKDDIGGTWTISSKEGQETIRLKCFWEPPLL